jgi:hypothetical protein
MTDDCYTGNLCWEPYNHLTRSILILSIVIGIVIVFKIYRKYRK